MHPLIGYDAASRDEAAALYDDLLALAASLGGTLTGEHGVGRMKRAQLVVEQGDIGMRIHRAIKAAFDPGQLLNPGAMLTDEGSS
jgi:glycolate oxidase